MAKIQITSNNGRVRYSKIEINSPRELVERLDEILAHIKAALMVENMWK